MSNRKTLEEKLEAARLEKGQAEARIKKLMQEQKAEERKARNHRFCKRGGFMEKLLPDLALLTDEQFETFFKNTTANNYGRKALADLVPPVPAVTAEQSGGDAEPQVAEMGKRRKSLLRTATANPQKRQGWRANRPSPLRSKGALIRSIERVRPAGGILHLSVQKSGLRAPNPA